MQDLLLKSLMMKKIQSIQIIPKKKVGLNETNLSEQLSKFFPNIDEVNKQDE